ncbi:hypothetical protein [Streptomyces lavendulae]|uniref:hypothetical protein n=1 Tax=Streptomyces lavendulae TaxID=1914 RepID=UPI0033C7343F
MIHILYQVAHGGYVLIFDTRKCPPIEVTLPHRTRDGAPTTKKFFFYGRKKKPIAANWFN